MPSVNKRIRYESFPADYRDGQVLRAQDVNKIIDYIYEGVNANKKDLDQILTGRYKSFVYYNVDRTVPRADDGVNGDYAFIYFNDETESEDKLVLFRKNNDVWVELYEVSLLKAFQRLDFIEGELGRLGSVSSTFKMPVTVLTTDLNTSGLINVDGINLNIGDRVLILNKGNSSGVYTAGTGNWNKVENISPGSIYSVDLGEVNGGIIVRVLSASGDYEIVKNSEAPRWEIIR